MKKLTLVYPVYKNPLTDNLYFLTGVKAPGTKLAGTRNGYGGKVEEGESVDECAMRELSEEAKNSFGIINKDNLKRVGKFIKDDKTIYVYAYNLSEMMKLEDGDELINFAWEKFGSVSKISIDEMLPGDEYLLNQIHKAMIDNTEFEFDKKDILTEGQIREVREITKGIFK